MSSPAKHNCSVCSLKKICLPTGVGKSELERLETLVQDSKVHHTGDIVVRQESSFKNLYAVKSGMYKSVKLNDLGEERVVGFHLPGDIIGLDAIYPKTYSSSLIALTSSVLCQFDYDRYGPDTHEFQEHRSWKFSREDRGRQARQGEGVSRQEGIRRQASGQGT